MAEQQALELVPTEALIQELGRRHDVLIISGLKFMTNEKYLICRNYFGNKYACLGLLSNMESYINMIENNNLMFDPKGDKE